MREVVQSLEESRIREVANEGLGRSDVLKFWFGESDEVTPDFIRDAAIASLQKGETFMPTTWACPNCATRLRATCTACTRSSTPMRGSTASQ